VAGPAKSVVSCSSPVRRGASGRETRGRYSGAGGGECASGSPAASSSEAAAAEAPPPPLPNPALCLAPNADAGAPSAPAAPAEAREARETACGRAHLVPTLCAPALFAKPPKPPPGALVAKEANPAKPAGLPWAAAKAAKPPVGAAAFSSAAGATAAPVGACGVRGCQQGAAVDRERRSHAPPQRQETPQTPPTRPQPCASCTPTSSQRRDQRLHAPLQASPHRSQRRTWCTEEAEGG